MNWTNFRIVADTDPPDDKSADDQARWGKLADAVLGSAKTTNTAKTRAHEDHERLKQQLRDAVDRNEEELKRAG